MGYARPPCRGGHMIEVVESFKPMFRMLWGAIALLVALKIFFLWWNSPRRKGARGEALVARRLREGLPAGYLVLNDVYLPLADGTTTQIDHVVVSQFGIFVVETKTYAGWIFGDERSAQWTQTIYRKKSRFQNPLRQNYRHICALADNLGIDRSYFQSVIASPVRADLGRRCRPMSCTQRMPPNISEASTRRGSSPAKSRRSQAR